MSLRTHYMLFAGIAFALLLWLVQAAKKQQEMLDEVRRNFRTCVCREL